MLKGLIANNQTIEILKVDQISKKLKPKGGKFAYRSTVTINDA